MRHNFLIDFPIVLDVDSSPYCYCFKGLKFTWNSLIPLQGGIVIGDFDNNIYVASQKGVYSLIPLSFDQQVCSMFLFLDQ